MSFDSSGGVRCSWRFVAPSLLASVNIASAALILVLSLKVPIVYPDFIVGNLAWHAETKFQDLIAAPVFIFVCFFGFWFTYGIFSSIIGQKSCKNIDELASQLVLWSIPFVLGVAGIPYDTGPAPALLYVSSFFILFILINGFFGCKFVEGYGSEFLSIAILACVFLALFAVEGNLVLTKLQISRFDQDEVLRFSFFCFIFLLIIMSVLLYVNYGLFERLVPRALLVAQLGLPLFFLVLYPAILSIPGGISLPYPSTVYLKIFITAFVLWSWADVFFRYLNWKQRDKSVNVVMGSLISPVAVFALFVVCKFGNTRSPSISSDDYHFGETLLGWWSYLVGGAVPYVGFFPPHGILQDGIVGFVSSFFYDGTAGTMLEASRIAMVVLVFIFYYSMFLYFRSLSLAFVAVFTSICWDLSGGILFLAPFFCIWFSKGLIGKPGRWLGIWVITALIVFLGIPGQGALLVASSGPLALFQVYLFLKDPRKEYWQEVLLVIAFIVLLAIFTPLVSMIYGAVRYVLENSLVNQVSYGVDWKISWNSSFVMHGLLFEISRTSWVIVAMAALFVSYSKWRNSPFIHSVDFSSIAVFLFLVLLIPYSMGRIDPGGLSRPGVLSVFSWSFFLPFILWKTISPSKRSYLVLCLCGVTVFGHSNPYSVESFKQALSPVLSIPLVVDGAKFGLPNVGIASVDPQHWSRLVTLNGVLSRTLGKEETYLDLTNRSAQYFYLNRHPPVSTAAPYNMASYRQQKREIEQLSKNTPKMALFFADNITHDGGGLALRNFPLYRFVLDNYEPQLEDGFIFGYRKKDVTTPKMYLRLKHYTDVNWENGVNRSDAAIILDDSMPISLFNVGDNIKLSGGDVRNITLVQPTVMTVWLSGAKLDVSQVSSMELEMDRAKQRKRLVLIQRKRLVLIEKSFAVKNIEKIPVAWGRSSDSLVKKMSMVQQLDLSHVGMHDMIFKDSQFQVIGSDPGLYIDLQSLDVSGRNSGILKFDIECLTPGGVASMQVFWWGDRTRHANEAASLRFVAESGTVIVPLDISPRWSCKNKIDGLRIDVDVPTTCNSFMLRNASLLRRNDA